MSIRRKSVGLLSAALLAFLFLFSGCAANDKVPVKVLILPKFEVDGLSGDFPGEAQLYYEHYLEGAGEYEIAGGYAGSKLYVKDGTALYVTGQGKLNSALSLAAILADDRFDFSDAYIMSTGCAGSAAEYTVMGDVIVVTATVDYDLGHQADIREMTESRKETWFHDDEWDDVSHKILNRALTDQIYELVRDTKIETTERTRKYMARAFDNAGWAVRDPMVLKGTVVTGDNYWKGFYDEANARLMAETYGCPDPYAVSEMEDNALAVVLDRMGMLDRYIALRCSVNMDVFMNGVTPETLWGGQESVDLSSEDSVEAEDIFETAMHNNFLVGSRIVDAILSGEIGEA